MDQREQIESVLRVKKMLRFMAENRAWQYTNPDAMAADAAAFLDHHERLGQSLRDARERAERLQGELTVLSGLPCPDCGRARERIEKPEEEVRSLTPRPSYEELQRECDRERRRGDRLAGELRDAEKDEKLLGMRLRRAEQANAALVETVKQKDAAYDRLVNSTQELIATGNVAISGLVDELEAAHSAIRPGIHPPKKDGWYKVLENRRGAKVELRYFGEGGWVLRGSESLPLVWIDKL